MPGSDAIDDNELVRNKKIPHGSNRSVRDFFVSGFYRAAAGLSVR